MRLLLLRHAKSSWAQPGMADFDRPLAARGNRDAPRMAARMSQRGLLPTLIITSAARRTRDTLAHLLPAFSHDMNVQITRALYEGHGGDYIEIASKSRGAHDCILMIGHNPSIQDAALQLVDKTIAGKDFETMQMKYATCALAEIDFGEKPLASGAGMLVSFTQPSDLNQHSVD